MVNVAIFSATHKKPVNVIFLVDTTSPYVYVCESAMAALGFNDPFPASFKFHIAGCPNVTLQAHMSKKDSHFSGINVMGPSALSKLRAKVTLDCLSDSVEIKFNSNRASP
jgi:dissimilatory sulfite reductase (desulfoviridin) alpha/beta subunit